jgi:hypothetical protein
MVSASSPLTVREHRPWIVDAGYDRLFFLGAWLAPLLLMGIYAASPLMAIIAFGLLDGSHVAATAPVTLFDTTSDAGTRRFYRYGLLAIGGLAVAVSVLGGTPQFLWGSIFNYWGAFHIIRQHFGFLKLYQHRAGGATAGRLKLEAATLYLGLAVPWIFAQSLGAVAFERDHLFRVPIPLFVPLALLVPLAGLIVALGVTTWRDARSGQAVRRVPLVHIALAISNWAIGAVVGIGLHSVFAMVLFITSFHDIQYHGIVWRVGTKRYSQLPGASAAAALFKPQRLFAYASILLLVGAGRQFLFGFFGAPALLSPRALDVAMNFAWAINFAHYFIDGRMWQMRRNPQMRRDLELSGPRPSGVVVA